MKDRGAVIEYADSVVGLAASVGLVSELGAWPHLEVAFLPAQAPYDLTAHAVDLVDGGGFAGGDEQVVVMVHVYRVDVEVVDAAVVILRRRDVGLVEAYMLEAAPFEEHLAGLDVKLLDDTLPRHAVLQAANRGEVPGHRVVDRDQRGVLRADEELVVVSITAVACTEALYLAVGVIEDHVVAWYLPPGKDGSSPVGLHLEVHRAPMRALQGTEPHHLPAIVEDHGTALPSPALPRSDEDVAGGSAVRLHDHINSGRAKVRPRAEGPGVVRRFAARRPRQRDPRGASARRGEEPAACELLAHRNTFPYQESFSNICLPGPHFSSYFPNSLSRRF